VSPPSNTRSHLQAQSKAPSHAPSGQGQHSNEQPRVLDTQQLFQGDSVVHLQHQGEWYRLQITRQGKLILTK
jgi:hemin uptake protein HemP